MHSSFIRLTILMLIGPSLGACSNSSPPVPERKAAVEPIKVTKSPMTVEKKYFDKGLREPNFVPEAHNQYANTNWYFRTKPRFEFDILTKDRKDKTIRVKLLIKAIDLKLSLPITVWLPEGASEEVLEHENGHIAICERLYKDAEKAGADAARKVINQTFEGTGDTLEAACQFALNRASLTLARLYSEKTVDIVNKVSGYYDKLAPQHPEPKYVSSTVDAAFQLHDKVTKAGGDLEKAFGQKTSKKRK